MKERTLAIVKPDAVAKHCIGAILSRAEGAGLRIVAGKLIRLSREDAGRFYVVHKERPFYGDLCDFMSSGSVFVAALEGEGAIAKWRDLMGATDPAKAAPGTIRGDLATVMSENVSHGSDSPESAAREIALFFPDLAG